MKIVLILNGKIDKRYDENFFKYYDLIVCVDGGYNNFKKLNLSIKPNYIIGDFDSIKNKKGLKQFDSQQVVFKDNQDETDSQFAIKFLLRRYKFIEEINFIYVSSSDRLDHLLCNILLMKQIRKGILVKIITAKQDIYLLKGEDKLLKLKNKKTKLLSIIPITNIKSITTTGLKWQLDSTDLNFGFIGGISNIIENTLATINLEKGECLIVVER